MSLPHHFAGRRQTDRKAGKGYSISKRLSSVPLLHVYLIAQNGDPRKPEVPMLKYFAIQARRQEISDAIAADIERLELRKQTAEEFKALSGAAREAGVHDRMFGIP